MTFQKHLLPTGLRLIVVPMAQTRTATVLVLVGTGSKYETKEINGISHFLEHMFFKGTKKRPNTLVLAETLDKVGGAYNAFTSKEYTGYWAKVDAQHLELALDWVSDIFLNSKLSSEEIEREKGVIIEEINLYLDNPPRYVADLWDELLYGDQPAGWSVLGRKEIIKRLKRNQFIDYLKKHYLASNTVVCLAGEEKAVNKLKDKVKDYFKKINIGPAPNKPQVSESQNKPEQLIYYKKTDQTHLCLGFRAPGYHLLHPDRYTLTLLAVILGGPMSSRLWIKVRERQGLAYYISTLADFDTETGCLLTRAGVDNSRVEQAIKMILQEYQRIKEKKVSSKELQKAKDYLKGSTLLGLESSDELASFYTFQEVLTGKIMTIEEKFKEIDKVTSDDLQRVAREIFQPANLNLALIGPFKKKFSLF